MVNIIKFRLSGDYGHFKIPYTNNNPLTYSFITKTALMGLIGAVVGIERVKMRRLFPILCDSLKYSLSFNGEFRKEVISSYCYNFNNITKRDRPNTSPKPTEHLKKPDWNIYIALDENSSEEVKGIFECFCDNINNGIYVWAPTLGTKQCNCVIGEVEIGGATIESGEFSTKTFVTKIKDIASDELIYSDFIPTHEDENWYSAPEKNKFVFFTDNQKILNSFGEYYKFGDDKLVMI